MFCSRSSKRVIKSSGENFTENCNLNCLLMVVMVWKTKNNLKEKISNIKKLKR